MNLQRIVKLTFDPEFVPDFLEMMKGYKNRIAAAEGCVSLKMLHGGPLNNIIFTYSEWKDESYLNAYRNSELFKEVWAKTKIGFIEKPEAWSCFVV
jgi:heme-degrading monooxygenase HmoA